MLFATAANPNQFTTLSGIMITLGVVIIAILMTASARRKIAKRQSQRTSPREMMEQIRRFADRGPGEDVDSANARFLDDAQRLMAQLDNKAARIEQLIADADDRIAQLAKWNEAPLPANQTITRQSNVQSIRPPVQAQTDRTDSNRPAMKPVEVLSHHERHASIDPLTRAVYDLADDGRRPIDIARELDEQIGKIELILALRGDGEKVKTSKAQNVEI